MPIAVATPRSMKDTSTIVHAATSFVEGSCTYSVCVSSFTIFVLSYSLFDCIGMQDLMLADPPAERLKSSADQPLATVLYKRSLTTVVSMAPNKQSLLAYIRNKRSNIVSWV